MEYTIKNNYLYKYNNNIIIQSDFESNNIECTVDENGFKLLNKIVEDGKKHHFEVSNNKLIIDGKAKIATKESQLPTFDLDFTYNVNINLKNLQDAANFVDDSGTFGGVFVNVDGSIFATNRFKLYLINNGFSKVGVILSPEFLKSIDYKNDEMVGLHFNKKYSCIILKDKKITSRLIDGEYPIEAIQRVLTEESQVVNFDKENYLKLANIGKLCGNDTYIVLKKNKISFEGDNTYTDDLNCEIEKFNAYEKDFTSIIKLFDKITVKYTSELKPLFFEEGNKKVMLSAMKK